MRKIIFCLNIIFSLVTIAQNENILFGNNSKNNKLLVTENSFPFQENINTLDKNNKHGINQSPKQNNICFTKNNGQWATPVLYKAFTKEGTIFLENNKFTFVYFLKEDLIHNHDKNHDEDEHSEHHEEIIHLHAYEVNFKNCNQNTFIDGKEKRAEYYNYFVGNNKNKWKGNVPAFNKIKYKNIYNNIDLEVYSNKGFFKYDFIVNPNANTNNIKLSYKGVSSIKIENNNLVINTSVNEVIELAPYAYQEIDGKQIQIECYYKLQGTELSFSFPNGYNKNKKLVIDPTLIGCTFAGALGSDTWGSPASYDNDGNIYIGARSFGAGYPTTTGAYQQTFPGGNETMAISKFNDDASSLIYATYIGGNENDHPHSLFINNNDEVFVLGSSLSTNYPTSTNAYDNTHNGNYDIVITHLNNTGSNIIGSTYLGGSADDGYNSPLYLNYGDEFRGEIYLDALGDCYISSFSSSTNFPTTSGTIQTSNAGSQDGIIVKLNSNLSNLTWSTYFGSTSNDAAYGIRVEPNTGDILVSGGIGSGNTHTWSGIYNTFIGGTLDGYILRLSPDASTIVANTYFGTNQRDENYFIDTDEFGNIYTYGTSEGTITPSAGVFFSPGKMYITKFTSDLSSLEFKTTIGNGSSYYDMVPVAFLVDHCNRIYISSHAALESLSSLSGYPTTSDALFTSGGIYIAVLEEDAVSLNYGTYFPGADHVDGGTSRFDPDGYIYQGMCSCPGYSTNLPTDASSYAQSVQTTNCDMGVFKMHIASSSVIANFATDTIDTLCAPANINFINNSINAIDYMWDFGDGTTSILETPTHLFPDTGNYIITLVAIDSSACIPTDTTTYYITVVDFTPSAFNNSPLCPGEELLISAGPPDFTNYSWSGPNGYLNSGVDDTVSVSTNTSTLMSGIYTVTITNSIGCQHVTTTDVVINPNPIPSASNNSPICEGETLNITGGPSNMSVYEWSGPNSFLSNDISPTITNSTLNMNGDYQIIVTDINGCIDSTSTIIIINPIPVASFTTDTIMCFGDNLNLNFDGITNGNATYTWNFNGGIANPGTGAGPHSINWNIAGNYTIDLTVTEETCSTQFSQTITVPPVISNTITGTDVSCFGYSDGTITINMLGGIPNYNYNWQPSISDLNNVSANTYSVTVTDANSCTSIGSITIETPTALELDLTGTHNNCFADEHGSITSTFQGGILPYTLQWSNNANIPDLNNLPANLYSLTLTDDNSCTIVNNFEVTEPNELVVSLPTDFIYCTQETELIASIAGGTPPYSYQWNTSETSNTSSFQIDYTDTYIVTVNDNNNCIAQDEITITIISVDLEAVSNKDTVCPGDPIIITTNIIGGIPPYNFWNNGQVVTYPIIVYPNIQDNYIITVVDACGNTANANIDVYTHPIQPLSFTADILQGCPPLTINFNQHSYNEGFSYVWDFDNIDENNLSFAINPTHTFTEGGFYDISVQSVDTNGCSNELTIVDMINVYPKPEAHFEPVPEVVTIIESFIDFNNYSINNYYNYWFFNDGNQSSNINPHHKYNQPGIYYPILVVESSKGCLDTAIHKIEVKDEFTLYVPTAFSPDRDAINDSFRAKGHGIDLDNYWIAIFDRWGEVIWESTDLFEEWNGTAKNRNKTVQNGVYKWLLICKDFKGIEYTRSGNVTVIR